VIGYRLAAGLGASLWTVLIGLAVIPFYVRYLGLEGYGLIGFLATAQALLQLLDVGLAATVNREVARATAGGDLRASRALLHAASLLQWLLAAAIGVAMALLAPAVATRWLHAETLSADQVAAAVALMALVIACRWPGALYHAALMGAQRIGLSSLLSAVSVTLGAGGVVLVLAFVSPTVIAYLWWQAAIGLALVLAARAAAWRTLGRDTAASGWHELRRVWRFTAGAGAIGVVGAVLLQTDKALLSSILPLGEYGAYMLASAIAAALYPLSLPFFNVLYPRFSALVHANDAIALAETYGVATRLLGTLVFPAAMLLCVRAEDVVLVWTGDAALALSVKPVLPLLAAGVALHCVMYVPYALQLAHGLTRISLLVGLSMLATAVPLTLGLATAYGARGGAAAWLAVNVLGTALGGWLTHRAMLRGLWARWFAFDVGVPLAVSVVAGALAWQAGPATGGAAWRLAGGIAWALGAFALSLALSPALRASLLQYVRHLTRRAPSA
jgi:O-antigen/teichoic acid export membrane protein